MQQQQSQKQWQQQQLQQHHERGLPQTTTATTITLQDLSCKSNNQMLVNVSWRLFVWLLLLSMLLFLPHVARSVPVYICCNISKTLNTFWSWCCCCCCLNSFNCHISQLAVYLWILLSLWLFGLVPWSRWTCCQICLYLYVYLTQLANSNQRLQLNFIYLFIYFYSSILPFRWCSKNIVGESQKCFEW